MRASIVKHWFLRMLVPADDGIRVRPNGSAYLSDEALLELYRTMLVQAKDIAPTASEKP